jgi:predicted TIM-barrel fold metal-dependent hydrolase
MDEPIIDAHHHVWRLDATPWLQGPLVPRIFGEYDAIRRDYLIDDFRADSAPCGVVASVHVQANVAPGGELAEVAWVAGLANGPAGITAFADLAAPGLAALLDAQMAAGPVRAIRQQLHWHERPEYRFATRPDVFDDPAWRAGVAALAPRGLAFELQVFPGQMIPAAALLDAFPETRFILLHAGMLEDRSPAGWAEWRAGMAALAARPNCLVKLSGLGTFLRRCDAALWRPVVEETLALFGPARALFGSNFPIEMLWTRYAALVDAMRECLRYLAPHERRAILYENAARIYTLKDLPA